MTEAHRAIGITLPIANNSAEKQIALTAFKWAVFTSRRAPVGSIS